MPILSQMHAIFVYGQTLPGFSGAGAATAGMEQAAKVGKGDMHVNTAPKHCADQRCRFFGRWSGPDPDLAGIGGNSLREIGDFRGDDQYAGRPRWR
jgi:hypothetical protein